MQYVITTILFVVFCWTSARSQAPSILEIKSDSSFVRISFDDDLDTLTTTDPENYVFSGDLHQPWKVVLLNAYTIMLFFVNPIKPGVYDLIIKSVCNIQKECASNVRGKWEHLSQQNVQPFELLITEIMIDPTPVVGLPAFEYIELYNNGSRDVNLAPLTLFFEKNAYSFDTSSLIVTPGNYIILADLNAIPFLQPYGKVHRMKRWPALRNTNGTISIQDMNTLIHSVSYRDDWYKDSKKDDGGWSLEMINKLNVCDGSANWIASGHNQGGTPGSQNSVWNTTFEIPLSIDSFILHESQNTISVYVNKTLGAISNIKFTPVIQSTSRIAAPNAIEISLNEPMRSGTIYSIDLALTDCTNKPLKEVSYVFAKQESITKNEILINEVLFNPPSGGVDYLELLNVSNKVISLNKWTISNGNTSQTVTSNVLIAPGSYWVVTSNPDWILQRYKNVNPNQIIKNSLPALPDESGTIILLNPSKQMIDSFSYHEDMHAKLLNGKEGVALERIESGTSSNTTWSSAAGTENYGTPTRKNSIARVEEEINKPSFTVINKTFSPSQRSGLSKSLEIEYQMHDHGYVLHASIFNDNGIEIINWMNAVSVANKGVLTWDGLDKKNIPVSPGIYIIYLKAFHLNNKPYQVKLTCIVL